MIILKLHLTAFGCFTETELNLGDNNANFQVVWGANEAGKSTALRAITGLFFEIPARTRDHFKHAAKDLRVSAELLRADGQRRTFIRRKGNRDTLLDPDNQPIPEAVLAAYLGGISEAAFAALYCLNHERLVQGGKDLFEGKGELAASLFQAGTGVVGLRRALAELEAEAEQLFKPRGSMSTINQALHTYDEARKRSRDLGVAPRDWKERRESFEKRSDELVELKRSWQERHAEKSRLERYQFALPRYLQRRQWLTEQAELGRVELLPETARSERERALQKKAEAATRADQAKARADKLQQELQVLEVPSELLAQAETINGIIQRLDGYRNAARDLPKVHAETERFETEAREILAELKPGHPLEQAEALRLAEIQRQRIQRLAHDHGRLQERLQNAQRQVEKARTDFELTKQELGQTTVVLDTQELEDALERARQPGDLEAQLNRETQLTRGLEQEAERDLRKLGLWKGTLEELERLPLPLPETVDKFDAELSGWQSQQSQLATHEKELVQECARLEREIDSLQLSGAVLTEENLKAARAHRETGWQLVRRAWLDHARDAERERAFDPQRALPEAYELSVANADQVADRLRREAERCAHLAELTVNLRECQGRKQEALEEKSGLTAKLADWEQRWQAIWKTAPISALSPKEMRSWLNKQAALARLAADIRRHRENIDHLKQNLAELALALNLALGHLGQAIDLKPFISANSLDDITAAYLEQQLAAANPLKSPASKPGPPSSAPTTPKIFSSLLQHASSVLRKLEEARRHRLDLEKAGKKLEKELKGSQAEWEQVQRSLEAWQKDWQAALVPLGLPVGTKPEEATIIIGKLDGLFNALKERDSRRSRAQAMEEYNARFEGDVSNLIRALAPDLATLPAEYALARLQAQLAQALSNHTKRQALERQITQETESLSKANEDRLAAETRMQTLMARAACSTLEELEQAEQKSERARRLSAQMEQNTQDLTGFTAGLSLEAFLVEMGMVNGDELPARIAELNHQIEELEIRRSALEQEVAIQREHMKASDGSAQAAVAAEEAQGALAVIREGAEQYVRLRLAAEILRQQMERYREQNQDPIIRRAGEIFPALTCHSFARLKTGFDEQDKVVLLGVRPSGEEVEVTGMSEGTRDQLFLALRLASLERQLAAGEPLPFIVDDVLINFDDERARATLTQLAEVARKTQVLFFTHHSRLVELTRQAVPGELLKVHQLG